ncbi:MAG TPA: DUF5678 domain-containing protein [Chthonomonadaceae bacterium]|nr:DUF5678 domain-containing protein [Chthonomonadaceae bacterium]
MATRKAPQNPEEPFQKEQEALRRQWARLLKQYEGQYVALYQGQVVGHSADDEVLAQELFETLGDVPFYIAKIEKQPTVYNLPSPFSE